MRYSQGKKDFIVTKNSWGIVFRESKNKKNSKKRKIVFTDDPVLYGTGFCRLWAVYVVYHLRDVANRYSLM